ncbi:MmgE/PrpD family protein [Achromobacter denitrificans]|uniref:MmgE/PrpD family protein n=1 Tax=Achromobacter denitrificans TaxID=32002 RepID=UPI000F6828C7|nr:MmgE/PrpD family protein [Achromobacter denitrificans]MDF3848399.1 MmgE/PrpD family protein [Achromobacter denitrificans]MDF3942853.1 MmgE/PrpD family protein [Achromobacter denitrificans]RSE90013.1 MmgE/PrpD family protein [Achromobacter denitrificans]
MSAPAAPAAGLTQAFAAFVANLRGPEVPAAVRAEARRAIADCLGGGLAGAVDEVTGVAAGTLGQARGDCTLWARAQRASAGDAALINGCAAHAHALDDTHESMRGHPSAPIVPAILALGEKLDSDGGALLTAYVAGVEVAGRLGRSVNDRHSQLGWHTTCTLGTVGAAAACASLLRLDAERARHALGIASSMAGGLRVNFGTMTKALHAGLAARNGVLAAQLAAGGMTASPAALEGREGFLQLFCDDGSQDPGRALQALGDSYEIASPGIVYKQYPTCSLMHALVDMVLRAREAGWMEPGGDLELRCGISRRLDAARTKGWPVSGLAAKFHVEYCVAVAACRGTQDVGDFTDEALAHPQARDWADKVRLSVGEDFPAGNGDYASLAVLRNGVEVFRQTQAKPLGHPSLPLPPAGHEAKFMRHATAAVPAERAARLWRLLCAPQPGSARELAAALSADGQKDSTI